MHFMLQLLTGLTKHSEKPLFKDFVGLLQESIVAPSWRTITYKTFLHDLEASAQYLQQHLQKFGVQKKDVVGIWITGARYEDVVNLYAVARAGFIPQVFSRVMATQGGTMINDLLTLQNGKALVYDPHYQDQVHKIAVPTLVAPELQPATNSLGFEQLSDLPVVEDDDVAIIFHTSGTTSGRPKPVPQSHKWLRFQSEVNWPSAWQVEGEAQKCFNNVGSFANVASATSINKVVPSGHCMIRTSKPDFDADELLAMINVEGLNNMLLYASRLSHLLDVARTNPKVLKALRNMQQISYTGEALNPDDIRWVVEQGLPVVAIYASTEICELCFRSLRTRTELTSERLAICLVSDIKELESLPSMRLIGGGNIQLLSVQEDGTEHHGKLFDVFVPADAPNCPHSSIRNRPNGHVTGDLFEEVKPGYFIFRKLWMIFSLMLAEHSPGGRSDDWIKSGKYIMGLCDTKSIEDTTRLNCADLVYNCVVVGNYKPVVLFVEPMPAHANSVTSPAELKAEILKRMEKFQAGLFPHERFDDRVVVVAQGSLPRTSDKGNIRRNAVEELYADVLKEIYSTLF
ncbi:hypothetical protein DXG01_011121 [Tephrocybe rancida]|nr:hypothetical protein DXG01_011121 [Tephrocybe rancida]